MPLLDLDRGILKCPRCFREADVRTYKVLYLPSDYADELLPVRQCPNCDLMFAVKGDPWQVRTFREKRWARPVELRGPRGVA